MVRTSKLKEKPSSVPLLPYIWLSRMLVKHNIKHVSLLPRKISSLLHLVKDHLGLRTTGVYSIPCQCGQVYIGQTGRYIGNTIKEHHSYIWLGNPDKSAVAEHRFSLNHLIEFQDTQILSTVPGYMDRLIR